MPLPRPVRAPVPVPPGQFPTHFLPAPLAPESWRRGLVPGLSQPWTVTQARSRTPGRLGGVATAKNSSAARVGLRHDPAC